MGQNWVASCCEVKTWWPGTELNRRRQPFQGCVQSPYLIESTQYPFPNCRKLWTQNGRNSLGGVGSPLIASADLFFAAFRMLPGGSCLGNLLLHLSASLHSETLRQFIAFRGGHSFANASKNLLDLCGIGSPRSFLKVFRRAQCGHFFCECERNKLIKSYSFGISGLARFV
jgi:hypothetical protein